MSRPPTAEQRTISPLARNKYGAKRCEIDGYRFDSLAEGRRYEELRLLLLGGQIRSLVVHPRFALYAPVFGSDYQAPDADEAPLNLKLCEGEYGPRCWARRIGYYTADFAYEQAPKWQAVIEDVKGVRTRDYILRKKLIAATYGIEITEIQA